MATISKMAAIVTANISGFTSGMNAAGQSASSFGQRFKGVAESVVSAAAIMGVGLSTAGSIDYIKNTYEAIDATAKLADNLGIGSDALGRLQYSASYAGVANEELAGGLTKMLKAIAGAQNGSKDAVAAFDKIGMSVADLKGLSPDQAFAKIGDALAAIHDPAQRAAATMAIFGKSGASLLPLLTEGSQRLAEEGAEAEKFGLALSRIDSAKVEETNDAFTKVFNIIQGAVNKLAVEMAPYLTALANQLSDVASQGNGLGSILVNAFQSVTEAVAYAADYLYLFPAAFHGFRAAALEAIAGVIGALDDLGKMGEEVINFFGGDVHWTDGLDELKQGLEQVAGEEAQKMQDAWDKFSSGENQQKVAKFFDEIKKKSTETAKEVADNAAKMGPLGGADETDPKEDKATKALKKSAEDLYKETRTPLEKFQEKIDEINNLFAKGEIDVDTYQRAIAKAEGDLDKATDKKKDKRKAVEFDAPSLLEAGSADAAQFVSKVQGQAAENERQRQIAEETKKQTELQRQLVKQMEGASIVKVMGWA